MGPSCLLGISRLDPVRKSSLFWPYNKSLIDQACSVKMAVFWLRFFFGQYPAILSSRLANNANLLQYTSSWIFTGYPGRAIIFILKHLRDLVVIRIK